MDLYEFKVNDYVICTEVYDENKHVVGLVGKVVGVEDYDDEHSTQYVSVEYDNPIPKGHEGCHACGKKGYCWCMPNAYLKLANEYKVDLI